MTTLTLAKEFSRIAARYERHAVPQRWAAQDLLAYIKSAEANWRASVPASTKIGDDHLLLENQGSRGGSRARNIADCPHILELGCGTGLFTRLLLDAFPHAEVQGVDISEAMLRVAAEQDFGPRVSFHAADAETLNRGALNRGQSPILIFVNKIGDCPLLSGEPILFNLIASNAAFQWFSDLPGTLGRMAGMLAPGGLLAFSYFGPRTYRELDLVLRETLGEEVRVSSSRFASGEGLAGALDEAGFRWEMQEKEYAQVFPSVKALLESIKFTGTRGCPSAPHIAWTPGKLAKVEEAYREHFQEIKARYQVYLVKGVRSQ